MGIPPAPDLHRPRDHILFLDMDILFLEHVRVHVLGIEYIRHVRVHVLGIMYRSDMYGYLLYMYDVSKRT